MPTHEEAGRFLRDYQNLSADEREAFKRAVRNFVADLRAGRGFRRGLRVTRVRGLDGCWEMTWAPDGRAIWMYGPEVVPGESHVVWVAIGGHEILP